MLQFINVSASAGHTPILKNISFSLRPHRLTALVGRNGSGKSTLLACVNQELPYTGQIMEAERDLALVPPRERAKAIAYLPQTLPAPHITAYEMAAFGRTPHLDLTGRLRERDHAAVLDALRDAGAAELQSRYVDTLSGGERQRVALAMILAQNTSIALLDEPTAHMDPVYGEVFLRQITQLKKSRKKTFLVVLHDLSAAAAYADDLVVLERGELIFAGPKDACLQDGVLEDTFGLRRYAFDDGRIFFAAK